MDLSAPNADKSLVGDYSNHTNNVIVIIRNVNLAWFYVRR